MELGWVTFTMCSYGRDLIQLCPVQLDSILSQLSDFLRLLGCVSQGHGAVSGFVASKDGDPVFLVLIVGSAVMLIAPKICQMTPSRCGFSVEKLTWQLKVGEQG